MNKEELKATLLAYRPDSPDQLEPEILEALQHLQHEPELRLWFEQHCAFQKALRTKFRQIPVPDGLKEQILSERKAYSSRPTTNRAMLVAVLGLPILLLIATMIWAGRPRESKSFANFRNRMVSLVARQYPKMDLETNQLPVIRRFLVEQHAPGDYKLPSNLEASTPTGCAVLHWQNKPVSMVCFSSTGKSPDLFLFVIDQADAPRAPANPTPQFSQAAGLSTAAWSNGNKTYLLAGLGDPSFLKKYTD